MRDNTKPSRGATSTEIVLGSAEADVKLGPCGYANYAATAPVTITNHSAQTLNYVIKVEFDDQGKLFASSVATIDNLHGRATVKTAASGVTTLGDPVHLTCKITDIRRFTT